MDKEHLRLNIMSVNHVVSQLSSTLWLNDSFLCNILIGVIFENHFLSTLASLIIYFVQHPTKIFYIFSFM